MPRASTAAEASPNVAPTRVQPVAKAVGILRYLGETGTPETVTNIARTLDINTSTCFNILRTLVAEGLLVFDERAKTYAIGLGIVQIAQRVLSENGKIDVLRPLLHELAESHGVTVTLWRFAESDRKVLVSVSQHSSAFQIQMQVGQRVPLYVGAFGKVLAAANRIPKDTLRGHFRTMRWARPPAFDEYWRDTERAAETGWALDDGNFAVGVTSVAVAVPGPDGGVQHGLVASMFQGQMNRDEIEGLAQDMLALAAHMSGLS